jgi:hypothetical protein
MVSRAQFEMISQRLVTSDPKFYAENRSANKEPVASTQAKILIGLKSLLPLPPSRLKYCRAHTAFSAAWACDKAADFPRTSYQSCLTKEFQRTQSDFHQILLPCC